MENTDKTKEPLFTLEFEYYTHDINADEYVFYFKDQFAGVRKLWQIPKFKFINTGTNESPIFILDCENTHASKIRLVQLSRGLLLDAVNNPLIRHFCDYVHYFNTLLYFNSVEYVDKVPLGAKGRAMLSEDKALVGGLHKLSYDFRAAQRMYAPDSLDARVWRISEHLYTAYLAKGLKFVQTEPVEEFACDGWGVHVHRSLFGVLELPSFANWHLVFVKSWTVFKTVPEREDFVSYTCGWIERNINPK